MRTQTKKIPKKNSKESAIKSVGDWVAAPFKVRPPRKRVESGALLTFDPR